MSSGTIISTGEEASVSSRQQLLTPWLVCFSAALFFFFEFMQVNMFNAITPSLIKEFSLSAVKIGQISANYFYANLIFLFPAGMLLDRFSTRKVILTAMMLCVLCTYIFSFAQSVWVIEICRFVTGIGGSFCFLSCIRLASRWFPPRRLALVIGLIVTMAMFGGMIAQTPMTLLTDHFGWRQTIFIDASAGLLMLLVIYWFVKDYPSQIINKYEHIHHVSAKEFWQLLKLSLLNSQNWLGGIYTSLLNLPIFLLGAMWGSLYLVQIHNLTRTQASFVTSMIFIGTIIGSPVIGWFSDRIGLRRLPMILCAILSLVFILIVMFVPHLSLISLLLLFFAVGFFTSAQIISYPLIAESNPRSLTGTSEGIASTLIMAGGISQPFFGWLMSLYWNHQYSNGLPIYSNSDFLLAMAVMPIAFVLGLIAALLIRETYCKAYD